MLSANQANADAKVKTNETKNVCPFQIELHEKGAVMHHEGTC